VADFLKAGCEVTILFADLHAFLDNMKELETANFLQCFVAFVKFLWMRIISGWFVPYTKPILNQGLVKKEKITIIAFL
jgi:hypothetical protein